eukprot:scaffold10308_cov69-Phaeocystis_antarctica.AAC.2
MIKKSGQPPTRRAHFNVYCAVSFMIAKKEPRFDFESRNRARANSVYIYTLYGADGSAKNSKFVLRFGGKQATRRHPRQMLRHDIDFFVVAPTHARLCVDPPPHLRPQMRSERAQDREGRAHACRSGGGPSSVSRSRLEV